MQNMPSLRGMIVIGVALLTNTLPWHRELMADEGNTNVFPSFEQPREAFGANGHTAPVSRMLFTPDGRELVTVSNDHTIRVWDLSKGTSTRVLRPPMGDGMDRSIYAAALSPDGTRIAVGGPSESSFVSIYLISLQTDEIENTFTGHSSAILDLAFSPDGQWLISASDDHTARVWDVRKEEAIGSRFRRKRDSASLVLEGHTAAVRDVDFSPDGLLAVTSSFDGTARIFELSPDRNRRRTTSAVAVLKRTSADIRCADWSPDGRWIATGSMDNTLQLWEPGNLTNAEKPRAESAVMLEPTMTVNGFGNKIVSQVQFTPNSKHLLYTTVGKQFPIVCGMIDVATGSGLAQFTEHTGDVQDCAVSPDGRYAATAGGIEQEIFIWRTSDGVKVQKLAGLSRMPVAAAWHPEGTTVAWGCSDATTGLRPVEYAFDLSRLEMRPNLNFQSPEWRRAQSISGATSLELSGKNDLKVIRAGRLMSSLRYNSDYDRQYNGTRSFTLLPHARAAVGSNFGAHIFDTQTGKPIRCFIGHKGAVWAIAPSPDNRFLVTACADMTVRIWNSMDPGIASTPRQSLSAKNLSTLTILGLDRHFDSPTGLADIKAAFVSSDAYRSQAGLLDVPTFMRPLMSMFVSGENWIVWTPEGYYAASPEGESLVGWHVNNGPTRLAAFYPAAKFRKQLYKPELIKLLLQTGSVDEALQQLGESKIEITDLLLPRVAFASP
jgi:WD40 repeat protein